MSTSDADAVSDPLTPVTVTVALPSAAELVAFKVSVLVVDAGLSLNDVVTPAGRPETLSATLPVNPPAAAIVITLVPLLPCTSVRADGEELTLKLG